MEDSKQRPPARVKPQAGATRCPFCHAGCEPEAEVVVCRACLSRHHAACWAEGGACASCQGREGLSSAAAEAQAAEPGVTRGDVGLWLLLVGVSGVILGLVQGSKALLQFFAEWGLMLPLATRVALLPAQYPLLTSLAVVAWVATAAMARKRRRLFVWVVVAGALVSVPLLVIALLLPVITLIQKL